MGDKLPQTIAVAPVFVSGESPPAAKLTAITAQMRAATRRIEKAIGDTLDQSYPYSADAPTARLSKVAGRQNSSTALSASPVFRTLDIVSLARLIGPASNLNPHFIGSNTITEIIPVGVHEYATRYPINNPTTCTLSGTAFVTKRATPQLVTAAGDWYLDADASRIYCYSATASPSTIEYEIQPSSWGNGSNPQRAQFNVIPDIAQLAAGGDGLIPGGTDSEDRYVFTTPTISHQQWSNAQSTTVLTEADPNYDLQAWLPRVLFDAFGALGSPPYQIPEGFCVLKNYTTGAVYSDATYWWVSNTEIRIGNVDLDTEIADGNQFYLVTVGTNITESIDDLRRKSLTAGSRAWGQELVDARYLKGWLVAEGLSGAFGPSENASNIAPQYLHRDGWRTGIDDGMNDQNIMRGDFVVGKSGATPGGFYATGGTTYKVAFGTSSQAWLRWSTVLQLFSSGGIDLQSNTTVSADLDVEGALTLNSDGTALSGVDNLPTWPAGHTSIKHIGWGAFNWTTDPTEVDFVFHRPIRSSSQPTGRSIAVCDLSSLIPGAGQHLTNAPQVVNIRFIYQAPSGPPVGASTTAGITAVLRQIDINDGSILNAWTLTQDRAGVAASTTDNLEFAPGTPWDLIAGSTLVAYVYLDNENGVESSFYFNGIQIMTTHTYLEAM